MTTTFRGITLPTAPINAKRYGAIGDGVTDDTTALQAAINAAVAKRTTLLLPATAAGAYYKITSPLTVTGFLEIQGEGPQAVQIIGTGLGAGNFVLDFNCLASDVIEHCAIRNVTIRCLDGISNGLRVKNVAQFNVEDSRVYGCSIGLVIDGTRCYTHNYSGLEFVQISSYGVQFAPGFTGGGQFVFDGCTLAGSIGLYIPSTAVVDNLACFGTNFEGSTSNCIYISGTCSGVTIHGCRTENNIGTSDFVFRPLLATEYVQGISILGCIFNSSNNASQPRVLIGGDAGTVRGFNICGNVVTHGSDSYATYMVNLNGDGGAGLVAGNFVRGTNGNGAKVINTFRAGVTVMGNENLSGKLPEALFTFPTTLTYSASITPDLLNNGSGKDFTITATNGTAFTINAPLNPPPSGTTQVITLLIRNAAGGAMGAITWNAVFKMSAWTNPANGFSRSISFRWDGTNWVQVSQTGVDVPN